MNVPTVAEVRSWDQDTLLSWLGSLKPHPLSCVDHALRDAGVDGDVFLEATEEFFREISLPAGVSKKLWLLAERIRRNITICSPIPRKRPQNTDSAPRKRARVEDNENVQSPAPGVPFDLEEYNNTEIQIRELNSMHTVV